VNRRNFLKSIIAVGSMGAMGAVHPELFKKIEKNSDVKYIVGYRTDKGCYLHQISGQNKKEEWEILEWSDNSVLEKEVYDLMLKDLRKKLKG